MANNLYMMNNWYVPDRQQIIAGLDAMERGEFDMLTFYTITGIDGQECIARCPVFLTHVDDIPLWMSKVLGAGSISIPSTVERDLITDALQNFFDNLPHSASLPRQLKGDDTHFYVMPE